MDSYLKVLKQYADFKGRARRKEYWMFVLFNTIIAILLAMSSEVIGDLGYILYAIYALAIIIPSIAVCVRRLHDTGKSGFWYFIIFVPIIGSIWLLILFCSKGQAETNNYGEDPKAFC